MTNNRRRDHVEIELRKPREGTLTRCAIHLEALRRGMCQLHFPAGGIEHANCLHRLQDFVARMGQSHDILVVAFYSRLLWSGLVTVDQRKTLEATEDDHDVTVRHGHFALLRDAGAL